MLWVHRETKSLRILDTLPGGHWVGARAHRENYLSLEAEKSPRMDLHRVVEHPVDSTRSLLEQRSARRASDSPYEREGKRINSLEVEATGKDQEG
jgi:hypothetical protein